MLLSLSRAKILLLHIALRVIIGHSQAIPKLNTAQVQGLSGSMEKSWQAQGLTALPRTYLYAKNENGTIQSQYVLRASQFTNFQPLDKVGWVSNFAVLEPTKFRCVKFGLVAFQELRGWVAD
eukprot:TRINITY_DN4078_c0_g2_i10.p1 TRINITY_DN4078_c0_g2~~TRINITY_DN4078_c0_g2_i10.p1  ORF type:complete len:122 (+),score=18.25 TRINITY_DN4078_c0_g2_i10:182-547(+)